jgi:AraC-like DNA-binding protein
MPVVAVAHPGQAARAALRRGLARRAGRGARLLPCRLEQVASLLRREVVDAVVVDARSASPDSAFRLMGLFPGIPMFALSTFRPDDGPMLMAWRRAGIRGILVEGVDDAAGGEWIAARTASHRRRVALRDAPSLLRLTEPLQKRAWEEVLARIGTRSRTADLAAKLGLTREHLSREFAAGGAPNLKRVIDLARVCCAADLLANPGYDVTTVSRVLRYASGSHFAQGSRRIAGVTPAELGRLGPRQVLLRFLKGRTRSRM